MMRTGSTATTLTAIIVTFVLSGCGAGNQEQMPSMETGPGTALTAEQVKLGTVARVESATTTLASDQHVFRFDGASSRTFTKCEGPVCGVSRTAAGLEEALARALADPRLDFGNKHFAERLKDSLTLKPPTETVRGVPILEGFGLRTDERAFRADFYGGWLNDGAFFVNRTVLAVRDEQHQPAGLGTVFDASAIGVSSAMAPATAQGMSATWKGAMIGVDVSDLVTRGQFVRGDATLVIDDFANPDVDVALDNFHDLETGARLDGRSIPPWENIPLDGSAFGEKPAGSSDYIQGRFIGEGHAGVVGIFERSEIVGSFGANRQRVE